MSDSALVENAQKDETHGMVSVVPAHFFKFYKDSLRDLYFISHSGNVPNAIKNLEIQIWRISKDREN